MIPWLDRNDAFPPLEFALSEPNGLLCAGADLSPNRILTAYRQGIFPWFAEGQPVLWWSPDPRMVLVPREFRISRSLRRTLRNSVFNVTFDRCFDAVIGACAQTPRHGQSGTWITNEMRQAYNELHRLGFAHSVESWSGKKLVGGLYGLAIGKMFYGESMFAHATDASKVALAHLARWLDINGFGLIDCQMNTSHLASLGAYEIPRNDFLSRLNHLVGNGKTDCAWPVDAISFTWT